ncbi:biosynthetic-type acetolactate synthase large subunit [Thermovenabulum gondwanense]|uniref:Acetolactate synthase n=1 Tax=Thermovenabulum gondwanense TaxID=520767 RepID=A0A162MVL8_9FIRM|nr:biosynthetic-type acetolactate synthase large subunit [Thermovenabulum gondwanense]KYO67835.1 Acetolactate synthase large subunit [Thermovenabulum gondwanense]
MTGADLLLSTLEELGVQVIFGFPGGSALPIYDALYRNKKIKHIRTVHEQGAAHAADGYARATGKVGVALSTSGPGATNLVTGIATAYMDSVPVVAFTGQVALPLLGRDSFQEVDITGVTLPITKHSFIIREKEKIVKKVKEAFIIASTGRPGPVVVDLPKDVMSSEVDPGCVDREINGFISSFQKKYQTTSDIEEKIDKAVRLMEESKRPVIYAGGGVVSSRAWKEVLELSEKISAPVAVTLMGLGSFPHEHPHFLGMLGMHGTAYANYAVSKCDLLIALGARFDDRVIGKGSEFAKNAKIIHIDIDQAELGKNKSADLPIKGDLKEVMKKLLNRVSKRYLKDWLQEIEVLKSKYPLNYKNEGLKPQYIIEKIWEITKGDALIATEVGQHQMWAAQYYKFREPRSLITSGGLGTMGFGLPAAVGAKIGRPDKIVFNIAGDGSFEMNCHELITAARYNIPIVVVIFNNGSLGMVRQWQELFYNKRYSHSILSEEPDYVKIALGCGCNAIRIKEKDEVEKAILEAIDSGRPTVIEAMIDKEENVMPMVPAGEPIYNMLGV